MRDTTLTVAIECIISVRPEEQVVWSDARWIVAFVEHVTARWNITNVQAV
jgi:hypothetical protein